MTKTNVTFPLRFRASAAFLAELSGCEYGSYEDVCADPGNRDPEKHTVAVIERSPRTVLVIRDADELAEVQYGLSTGTIGLYRLVAANNLLDKINPIMDALGLQTHKRYNCGL